MREVVAVIALILGLLGWAVVHSSEREASVYNKQFGTSYTWSDFFWAGETIRTLNKQVNIKDVSE